MTILKSTIVWLVFLVHLNLEPVQCLAYVERSCPITSFSDCPPQPSNRCNNDQDCEASYPGKGLKCCGDCGKSCVTPVVSKVKVTTPIEILAKLKILTKLVAKCPTDPPSKDFPPGRDQECQNDASCDAKYPGQDLKCCSDGDDFRCMSPVVESVKLPKVPGYCPAPPTTTSRECYGKHNKWSCYTDADCETKYPALKSFIKCCNAKCGGRKCMISIQGKPPPTPSYSVRGTCFIFPPPEYECPPEPDNECTDDQQCSRESDYGPRSKCCLDGCDLRCVPIFSSQTEVGIIEIQGNTNLTQTNSENSKCPRFPLPPDCPEDPDNECTDDLECSELHPGLGLVCCVDGCDLRCLPPIPPPMQ